MTVVKARVTDLMPRETMRSRAGSPGYLAEHSPAMLELLDITAQPTMFAKQEQHQIAIHAYRIACVAVVERRLGDAEPGALKYWTDVRDNLMIKYKFTEAEINDGD